MKKLCPECGKELLESPTFSRTTSYFCMFHDDYHRHFTLDLWEVLEPADYWLDEKSIQYIKHHWGKTVQPSLNHQQWLRWVKKELGLRCMSK